MSPRCVRFSRFNKFKSKNVNAVSADFKEHGGFEWQPVLTRTRRSSTPYRMQTNCRGLSQLGVTSLQEILICL